MSRHDRASAGSHRDKCPRGPAQPTSEELAVNRADDIIRQSEASKARILDITGRNVQILPNPNNPPHNINTRRVQIDDGYVLAIVISIISLAIYIYDDNNPFSHVISLYLLAR